MIAALFALLAATLAFGDAPADRAEIFKGKSTVILDRLLSKGITDISSLSIQSMREAAPEVTWKALPPGETVPLLTGGRTSAFYQSKEKTVTVIADPSIFNENLVDMLSLHETLGALGYDDRQYQLTIALYAYSLTNEDNDVNKEERKIEAEAFFPLVVTRGGGTGVDGGGDFIGLAIKLQTLLSLWGHRYQPQHYRQFLLIRFEASYEKDEPMNRIAFDQRGEPYLVVPAVLWLSKKTYDERYAIARMADLLVEGLFIKNLPKFVPRAQIKCQGAARTLTFNWVKPIPDLIKGLEFYFRGNKCTFELTP